MVTDHQLKTGRVGGHAQSIRMADVAVEHELLGARGHVESGIGARTIFIWPLPAPRPRRVAASRRSFAPDMIVGNRVRPDARSPCDGHARVTVVADTSPALERAPGARPA